MYLPFRLATNLAVQRNLEVIQRLCRQENDQLDHVGKCSLSGTEGIHTLRWCIREQLCIQYKLQQHARKTGKVFCAVSIDLTNAFGSIPHRAIYTAFKKSGAGELVEDVSNELLEDASTFIASSAGEFGPVRIRRSVSEGDPLERARLQLCF